MEKTEFFNLLATLRAQDEQLKKIFAEREAIRQKCFDKGGYRLYDEMWEALYKDGKNHYDF